MKENQVILVINNEIVILPFVKKMIHTQKEKTQQGMENCSIRKISSSRNKKKQKRPSLQEKRNIFSAISSHSQVKSAT